MPYNVKTSSLNAVIMNVYRYKAQIHNSSVMLYSYSPCSCFYRALLFHYTAIYVLIDPRCHDAIRLHNLDINIVVYQLQLSLQLFVV